MRPSQLKDKFIHKGAATCRAPARVSDFTQHRYPQVASPHFLGAFIQGVGRAAPQGPLQSLALSPLHPVFTLRALVPPMGPRCLVPQ